MNIHEKYISRCIELGKLGIGNTYPNPSVGCCLVVDDKIIGEGYTSIAGGNHAEVNAINSVENKSLIKEVKYDVCYLESTSALKTSHHLYKIFGFENLEGPMGNTSHHNCDVHMTKKLQ